MAAESPPDRERLRRALLTGVTVVVPAVIIPAAPGFAFNAIDDYLDALSTAIVPLSPPATPPIDREVATEIARSPSGSRRRSRSSGRPSSPASPSSRRGTASARSTTSTTRSSGFRASGRFMRGSDG